MLMVILLPDSYMPRVTIHAQEVDMRKLLPLLFLLTNASIVLAQGQPPYEQNSNSQSSQQSVEQAINLTASHPSLPAVRSRPG